MPKNFHFVAGFRIEFLDRIDFFSELIGVYTFWYFCPPLVNLSLIEHPEF
jgi:hypothetical protein